MRTTWDQLPAAARAAVTDLTGPVTRARDETFGANAQLVASLHTTAGRLFCKAANAGPALAALRNEARVTAALPAGISPGFVGAAEAAGWLLLLTRYSPGRHADLTPGSPDLDAVADMLTVHARELSPAPVPALPLTRRLPGVDPHLLAGETLLHLDVTPRNILVRGGYATMVDWTSPAIGPDWVDTAMMTVRLVRAGHTPTSALAWAQQTPMWAATSPATLAAILRGPRRTWSQRAAGGGPHLTELVAAADELISHLHRRRRLVISGPSARPVAP